MASKFSELTKKETLPLACKTKTLLILHAPETPFKSRLQVGTNQEDSTPPSAYRYAAGFTVELSEVSTPKAKRRKIQELVRGPLDWKCSI